jgi:hypothetical protein
VYAVSKLRQANGAHGHFRITQLLCGRLQEPFDNESSLLGLDQHVRIENHSHSGGVHGRLRLAIPSSTSFIKPSSRTAVVPRAFANAMDSDISRPFSRGCSITAIVPVALLNNDLRASLHFGQHAMNIAR